MLGLNPGQVKTDLLELVSWSLETTEPGKAIHESTRSRAGLVCLG